MHKLMLVLVAAAALTTSAQAASPPTKLFGVVGPGFSIVLKDAKGKVVKSLPAGRYAVTVDDKSSIHDFHLRGPGVNTVITTVAFVGKKTVTLTLKGGTYLYQCDPHLTTMKGRFTVLAAPKLLGTVGPGFTISLKKATGQKVKTLKAGVYSFVVTDKANIHNFVLEKSGGGFEKTITGVGFVGKKTLTIKLTPGKWEFYCRPHEATMEGEFTVRA